MNFNEKRIIYRDIDLIVAVKPAGMPVLPDKLGTKSFQDYILEQIEDENCSTNAIKYNTSITSILSLSAVNRLDRPVGGLVLFALSPEAKAWFSKPDSCMEKSYKVIVKGLFPADTGEVMNFLVHDEKKNMSRIVPEKIGRAKRASLSYKVIAEKCEPDLSLAEIQLHTGRHHQIRVQLSALGCQVWGDRKYSQQPIREKSYTCADLSPNRSVSSHSIKMEKSEKTPKFPALFSSKLSFYLPGKKDALKVFEADPFTWEPFIFPVDFL